MIVGAAVVIIRGAVEWFNESDGVLAVEEGMVAGGGWVEWKGKGDAEGAEEKGKEVTE